MSPGDPEDGREARGVSAAAELDALAAAVGARLRARGETLALAESCTGGLIAAALSAVPGASDWLWGGAVVYTRAAKRLLAGVDDELLRLHGTVSAPTTEALATAIQARSGASYGLAVTGWAGPDAGQGGRVGTVFGALAGTGGLAVERWQLPGDRARVRLGAAVAALGLLRRRLETPQDGAVASKQPAPTPSTRKRRE